MVIENVCIVGYGSIGPIHAAALEDVKNSRLYAVCDIDGSRRKLCSKKYNTVEYDDFDKMLLDEEIDSIHICTPHYLHFEMIKKALAAGKDVVVEKPVTRTQEEFFALQKLDGIERVCVVLQNRLNPCVQKLKQIVQSGELGTVKAARGILTWHRDQAYYESEAWRGKWSTEGGGLLINQAIHTLDYFPYVIGDVKSVHANMFNYSLNDIIEVEDTFTAYLELESGVKGIFFATNAYTENATPLFEVVFEQGVVRYTDKQLWLNGQLIEEDVASAKGKDYWGGGHAELIRRFYDENKYFSVADAANTMNTVFKMYESAKNIERRAIK